jgi:hypothetical protein
MLMAVLSYIIGWLIGLAAIILPLIVNTLPTALFIAFGIATLIAVTWVAYRHRPGEPSFDIGDKTIWAKFSELESTDTVLIIVVYVVAIVIGLIIGR